MTFCIDTLDAQAKGGQEALTSPSSTCNIKPEIFLNPYVFPPGTGWQTCDRTKKDNNHAYEANRNRAYFKFYWADLEPADGEYDFTRIDQAIAGANKTGQVLDIRPVMPFGPDYSAPDFLRANKGVFDAVYNDGEGEQNFLFADFNQPQVLSKYLALIKELGRKYNNAPTIGLVDISAFGLWGEDHIGEVALKSDNNKDLRSSHSDFAARFTPSTIVKTQIIDAFFQAFPNKQLLVQIVDPECLKYAIKKGAGIRFDCFGGHYMEDQYPRLLKAAGAENVWKTAPIAVEISGDLQGWGKNWGDGQRQYNNSWLQNIFGCGLGAPYHICVINCKNKPVPDIFALQFEDFIAKVGYRYGISSAAHQQELKRGQEAEVQVEMANFGSAPAYNKNLQLVLRVVNAKGESLLGDIQFDKPLSLWEAGLEKFSLRATFDTSALQAGEYKLDMRVIDTKDPGLVVSLVNKNPGSGAWYPISSINIRG